MGRTELSDGALVVDGIVVGEVSHVGSPEGTDDAQPTITLHLGWAKAAGVRVVVHGETGVDRKRGGIVLDR